jgi:hypothetical protein
VRSTEVRGRARPHVMLVATAVVVSLAAGLGVALPRLHGAERLAIAVAVVHVAVIVVAVMATAGRPRAVVVIGAIGYVGGLHWIYVDWVSPLNAYRGLISTGVDALTLVTLIVIAVVPSGLLPLRLERPSEVVLWFLYLMAYVPATSIPIHLLGPDAGVVFPFTILLGAAFVALLLMQRIPRGTLRWSGLRARTLEILALILGLGSIGYIIAMFGVPAGLPSLGTVYDRRTSFNLAETDIAGSGYIVPWAGNVVFPFVMALGLARRRFTLVVLGVAGDLLVYGTTGSKAILFSLALLPVLYLFIRFALRAFGPLLMWSGVAVMTSSVLAIAVSDWPRSLFVTRLLVIPGELTAYYYEFFTTHPTYALSRSFLRFLGSGPSDIDPPNLIGRVYLHDGMVHPNANVWADAIANYGLIGIVPFTIILGAVLWLLDTVAWDRDIAAIGPMLSLVGVTLSNGALFTCLLTQGIVLTIGLVALLPRRTHGRHPPATAPSPPPHELISGNR